MRKHHFFSVLLILHPFYIIFFPHPDLLQLYLGLDHTKFTQDHPPVQSDIVPLCNMAFLTTRKGVPTYIHPSPFTYVGDFSYYYYSYYYYSTRPFSLFISYN